MNCCMHKADSNPRNLLKRTSELITKPTQVRIAQLDWAWPRPISKLPLDTQFSIFSCTSAQHTRPVPWRWLHLLLFFFIDVLGLMQYLSMRLINRVFPSKSSLFRFLSSYSNSSSSSSCFPILNPNSLPFSNLDLFNAQWSTLQSRGIKVSASDVRVGNIIEKQGRLFEVLKADHSQEGRGKASIKVELRDIAQGNKIELSRDLFAKNASYLQPEMNVKVQLFEEKPLSASVPKRVTCTVKECIAATPRNKKVVLENGIIVEVPPHIVPGDAIVVNTEEDSYLERAKA
ncbi:hypothetical protein PIB30_036437 [Stylosanthes scabra]|uniref:Elongation factor P C-terminal domain-containing protein n=1 Tax=Stylosanthes scabra TaxID=79078 RepID=A0ABU6TD92_9FABA|nr:hypothetical protein [Stylosanthes scabra]